MRKSAEIAENKNFEVKNGRNSFTKGNKIGRMKKNGYTRDDLTKAVMEYDRTHDTPILKHYIEELGKDNNLLKDFINKYIPSKTINELTGVDGSPLTFIIEKTYKQAENEGK